MMSKTLVRENKRSLGKAIVQHKYFYLMVLPVVIWYILFSYGPMYGIILAFKTFDYSAGIWGSPWIGFDHFKTLASDMEFRNVFKNTLIISFTKLIIHFPLPVILAMLLNEFSRNRARKFFQTVLTFPHFISWVVLAGVIMNIVSTDGVYTQILSLFGVEATSPLTDVDSFRPLLYITHIWKEIGWDSIIYMAALAGVNPELYEAAEMDGASRMKRIIYVAWPGIKSTVAIMLILAVGNSLGQGSGFEQIFNLYTAPVYSVADTIDTYIYRTTFTTGADFGYMTALGLLKSVINLLLLYLANTIVKRSGEQGLY